MTSVGGAESNPARWLTISLLIAPSVPGSYSPAVGTRSYKPRRFVSRESRVWQSGRWLALPAQSKGASVAKSLLAGSSVRSKHWKRDRETALDVWLSFVRDFQRIPALILSAGPLPNAGDHAALSMSMKRISNHTVTRQTPYPLRRSTVLGLKLLSALLAFLMHASSSFGSR